MEFIGYLLNSVTKSVQIGWELLKPIVEGVRESFTDNNNTTQYGGKRHNKTHRRKNRRSRNTTRRSRRKHK
jgi:hypothetical protein